MNAEDRQALREKHRTDNNIWCVVCVEVLPNTESFQGLSGAATPARYPCDVIKVLDATEFVKECNHIEGVEIPEWKQNVWLWFTFCPKCGEKL